MNQCEARKRQQVIETTLAGLKAMLMDDKTLLLEMDPSQEERFSLLLGIAIHKGLADI